MSNTDSMTMYLAVALSNNTVTSVKADLHGAAVTDKNAMDRIIDGLRRHWKAQKVDVVSYTLISRDEYLQMNPNGETDRAKFLV